MPEYGLNIFKKNMVLLEQYRFENIILTILESRFKYI